MNVVKLSVFVKPDSVCAKHLRDEQANGRTNGQTPGIEFGAF